MQVLYWLEKIRVPILNELMLAVTHFGEETAFLAIALIVFWCVDKKKGYYLLSVGFFGTMANQFVKLLCRVPRPWVIDEGFSILEAARAQASGYSFPSGHTQMAVGTYGAIASVTGKRYIRIVCIVLAVLVPISRMYVGVHTPWDVLVGAGMALLLIIALKKPMMSGSDGAVKAVLASMIAASLLLLAYVSFYPFPEDIEQANLVSGCKNAYTMLGCTVGIAIVYLADRKLDFPIKAPLWAQIVKTGVGLVLVVAVKSLLKSPLEAVLPVYTARAVRYLIVVLVAGVVYPMTFSRFSRLGEQKGA